MYAKTSVKFEFILLIYRGTIWHSIFWAPIVAQVSDVPHGPLVCHCIMKVRQLSYKIDFTCKDWCLGYEALSLDLFKDSDLVQILKQKLLSCLISSIREPFKYILMNFRVKSRFISWKKGTCTSVSMSSISGILFWCWFCHCYVD